MTLTEGRGGLLKPSEYNSNRQSTVIWGEGVGPNRHITFIVAKNA